MTLPVELGVRGPGGVGLELFVAPAAAPSVEVPLGTWEAPAGPLNSSDQTSFLELVGFKPAEGSFVAGASGAGDSETGVLEAGEPPVGRSTSSEPASGRAVDARLPETAEAVVEDRVGPLVGPLARLDFAEPLFDAQAAWVFSTFRARCRLPRLGQR